MLHSFNPLGDRTPRRLSAATRELAARYLSGEIGSTLRPAPQAAGDEPYPVQLRRLAAEAETALSPDERLAGAARWLEATFHRFPGTARPSVSHGTADFRHAVTGGLAGLEADIAAGRRANPEGAPFYDELAACIGAMRLWVERYRAELEAAGYAGPVSLLLPGERYAGRPSWPEERALEVLRGGAE